MMKWNVCRLVVVVVSVAGGCAVVAGAIRMESPPKNFGRMVVTNELLRIHARLFVTGTEDGNARRDWLDETIAEFMPANVDYDWNVRYVPQSSGLGFFEGDKPNKLEEAAISELRNGADEVWQGLSDGRWQLVTALRTKDSCWHCHGRTEGVVKHGGEGPLGYVSVTLSRKRSGQ